MRVSHTVQRVFYTLPLTENSEQLERDEEEEEEEEEEESFNK